MSAELIARALADSYRCGYATGEYPSDCTQEQVEASDTADVSHRALLAFVEALTAALDEVRAGYNGAMADVERLTAWVEAANADVQRLIGVNDDTMRKLDESIEDLATERDAARAPGGG